MKQLTHIIAQALVDAPDQVAVTALTGGHTLLLKLRVGQGDAGKIIGKHGRTVDAFRTILNAVAAKNKKRIILDVANDDTPPHRTHLGRRTPHRRETRVWVRDESTAAGVSLDAERDVGTSKEQLPLP